MSFMPPLKLLVQVRILFTRCPLIVIRVLCDLTIRGLTKYASLYDTMTPSHPLQCELNTCLHIQVTYKPVAECKFVSDRLCKKTIELAVAKLRFTGRKIQSTADSR